MSDKPSFRTVIVVVPFDDEAGLLKATERALGYVKDGALAVRIVDGVPGKREESVVWNQGEKRDYAR